MDAAQAVRKLSVTLEQEKEFEKLSPFELKDKLIALSKESSRQSARTMLNAGRGNPNWIATTPRNAFFALGNFALEESKSVWDLADLGGMPQKPGIAERFERYAANSSGQGMDFLQRAIKFGTDVFGFDAEAFLYELVDGLIGDQYPSPDRMLVHAEKVVHEYLLRKMGGGKRPAGSLTFSPSRAAPPPCAISLNHCWQITSCSGATRSRWQHRRSRRTSRSRI